MIQAMLLGLICLGIYSIFLSLRGIYRLYQDREKKMLFCVTSAFLLLPVLFFLALHFGDGRWTIWLAAPTFFLGLFWLCMGMFLDSYMKREKKRKMNGEKREILKAPKQKIRNIWLQLLGCIILWWVGAFVGIKNSTLETCALCVCVFLFARSLADLWKYRGF